MRHEISINSNIHKFFGKCILIVTVKFYKIEGHVFDLYINDSHYRLTIDKSPKTYEVFYDLSDDIDNLNHVHITIRSDTNEILNQITLLDVYKLSDRIIYPFDPPTVASPVFLAHVDNSRI